MLRQYGQEVHYLSDYVRKFNLKQGNVKGIAFIRTMEFASMIWKLLFRKSIWEIKTQVLTVDRETNTITIPEGCERLINLSVIDKYGKLHPLTYNPDISTVNTLCQQNKCSCTTCGGVGTLCEAMDNITAINEDVVINGETYQKTTYMRGDGCTIQREEHVPAWDSATSEVVYVTNRQWVCDIEVSDKGCILPTAPNILALQTYCGYNGSCLNNGYNVNSSGYGYGGFVNPYRGVAPVSYNFFGYFNWDAASRSIIHIFRTSSNIYLNNRAKCEEDCRGIENEIVKVIISYQTNGSTPGEEILIPEYCVMAMDAGILWQQAVFNSQDGDRSRKKEYYFNSQKMDLNKYLNPIRIDDVKKVQTNLRPW
jgi:hypothetical protein